MTRWNLSISEDTDRVVRRFLARSGRTKGDLSQFVDAAVRRQVFDLVVRDIKQRHAGASQDELAVLIDEAVESARTRRSY